MLPVLGGLAWAEGNVQAATAQFEQSLASARKSNSRDAIAECLALLGMLAVEQGDPQQARTLLEESLEVASESGYLLLIARGLEGFAMLATHEGEPLRAARLFGAAEQLRHATGTIVPAAERAAYDAAIAALHVQSDPFAFRSAWADGGAMSREQAVAYALNSTSAQFTPIDLQRGLCRPHREGSGKREYP
ncbi:MAG: tetratricopeptide repeat protein [Herpetosiphonaceae bacterium]|nr:tetratricopeptide repeat protein [Herpetosiphonaceae bacterium]